MTAERASLVKRSEMDLSWSRPGSRMCTSGSRQRGSWIPSTIDAPRTRTATSWVIVVSREAALLKPTSSLKASLEPSPRLGAAGKVRPSTPRLVDGLPELVIGVLVMMVRERRGTLSFLVRRRDAEVAFWAERRARWRGARGTSRLMVLFAAADWMV